MIGLQRGTVSLTEYQAEWKSIAEQTVTELKEIFGECAVDIQHIGSTSIVGIMSKSIIDLAVGVKSFKDLDDVLKNLEDRGYSPSQNRFSSDLLYVTEDEKNGVKIRTRQVHILIYDCVQWHNYVDFRDYMNAFPEKAKEYEDLKIRLAHDCNNMQKVYTDGKKEYMNKVLPEARKYAASNQIPV